MSSNTRIFVTPLAFFVTGVARNGMMEQQHQNVVDI
jgi:hypothetical protein